MVGGSPLGGQDAAGQDQEVSKVIPGAGMMAHTEAEGAEEPSHSQNKDETSGPADAPDLLESSWLTRAELRAFT